MSASLTGGGGEAAGAAPQIGGAQGSIILKLKAYASCVMRAERVILSPHSPTTIKHEPAGPAPAEGSAKAIVFDPALLPQAAKNLSTWQSTLFYRVADQYKQLEKSHQLKEAARHEPDAHQRYDIIAPFISCPDGSSVGVPGAKEDAGAPATQLLRVLSALMSSSACALPLSTHSLRCSATPSPGYKACMSMMVKSDCIVYSLGSNGNYVFEEGILKQTKCKVTCTREGERGTPCEGARTRHASMPAPSTRARPASFPRSSLLTALMMATPSILSGMCTSRSAWGRQQRCR